MHYDVIVIGGGAAGLFCAFTAGRRGKRVLVIEHANRCGKKILMSGGGRCNFTNTGATPMRMIYCYGPAGDVAHWRQELDGTLPRAGVEVPALPAGAAPQCTEKPKA